MGKNPRNPTHDTQVNKKVYMPPPQHVWNRYKTRYNCNGVLEEEADSLGFDADTADKE